MFTQQNTLTEDQQVRLKELRAKQDRGEELTDAEQTQFEQLEEAERSSEEESEVPGPTTPATDHGNTHTRGADANNSDQVEDEDRNNDGNPDNRN